MAGTSVYALHEHHLHLTKIYKDIDPTDKPLKDNARKLMRFNGVYTLDTKGAFFAVDANLIFMAGWSAPINDLALIISLDGTSSTHVNFTGSFDGSRLVQISEGVSIDLEFHHTDGRDGIMAKCSGHITLPGHSQRAVSGGTYNKPIPYSVFVGEYFVNAVPVLKINKDYSLLFDFGNGKGILKPVPSYVYNLNMYVFSAIGSKPENFSLIMGSSAGNGLACNCVGGPATLPRMLTTIPFPDDTPFPNIHSRELAKFSGYYQIPLIGSGAFVSIQGEYNCKNGNIDKHMVRIGVSTDGKTSKSYYFDERMSFHDDELTTPDLRLKFERHFSEELGPFVQITGSVAGHEHVTGYTYFNPVPLSGFSGATMTDIDPKVGASLTVVSDYEVIFNGKVMRDFTYVPIMYILAGPVAKPTIEMSFGTAGSKGNACIITQQTGLSTVFAIPTAAAEGPSP